MALNKTIFIDRNHSLKIYFIHNSIQNLANVQHGCMLIVILDNSCFRIVLKIVVVGLFNEC